MKLEHNQIEQFIELLREHHEHSSSGYFSERKVRLMVEREIDNPKTLILVNKQMSAVLVFMVVPAFFTTQPDIQEVCFYSRTKGSGFRLLKEAQPWLDSWGDGVRARHFMSTGDEETNNMLKRYGMKQVGTIFELGVGNG